MKDHCQEARWRIQTERERERIANVWEIKREREREERDERREKINI